MDRRVKKVFQLLEYRWRDPLRVADLAQHVGLGTSRLAHIFKQQVKMTIHDFVRQRRLDAAAAMLISTEERISTISHQVGFTDISNFNHAFKQRFGVSPREYRERFFDRSDQQTAASTK